MQKWIDKLGKILSSCVVADKKIEGEIVVNVYAIQCIIDEMKAIPIEPPVMQKITGIRWEQRYSTTLEDDEQGRWMRLGRINGMTVAIILKVQERFIVKLPNNRSDESLENAIIVTSEQEAMLEAEKYIAKYVSNFSA